jgi:hypothetical protein
MGRLVWVAVGAAGGIWAYRKANDLIEQAREQGVALTVQQVALSTTQAVNQVSAAIGERAARPNASSPAAEGPRAGRP